MRSCFAKPRASPAAGVVGWLNTKTYYSWVDQHDTLGLGKDVPIATGNENDALLALVPKVVHFQVRPDPLAD